MLRLLVLALLLANAGYFAWTQRLFADFGFAPVMQAEPQRLREQIRPEAMHLLAPADARLAESPPIASASPVEPSTECLQAGLFSDAQANKLRSWLEASMPGGNWSFQGSTEPGRWLLYMGKFANADALQKKQAELRVRKQAFESVVSPPLSPGLSLGHYSSASEAEQALAKAVTRGIRTARVVVERPEATGQLLRVNVVNAAVRDKLDALRPQLERRVLQTCN